MAHDHDQDRRSPRRIVTGLREDGSSYLARVEAVEEVDYEVLEPGSAAGGPRRVQKFRMWGGDHLPLQLPVDGLRAPLASAPSADDTHLALRRSSPHPPKGDGFRITMYVMHPAPDGQPARPNFHWHDTVDCQWLASGRIAIVMDDGDEVVMEPGDALIQHGTNHAWRVIGDEPAVLYMFMLGAERVGATPPPELENVATPGGQASP